MRLRFFALLVLATVLALVVGCGRPFTIGTAPGFIELERQEPTYQYRATSPEGVVVGVQVIDLNAATPTATTTAALSQERMWSSATVMADGNVLVSGGSAAANQAVNVAYHTELWNPSTGAWTSADSYTLKISRYTTPFSVTVKMDFAGNELKFSQQMDVGNGPREPVVIAGKAE